MVTLEGSHIFPLSVADAPSMSDRHPAPFANRLAVPDKALFEPRDHQSSLRPRVAIIHVIIRQRHVKRVASGDKAGWNEIRSIYRIILAPVVGNPIQVPGTNDIRNRIGFAGLLPDPKHRH